MSPVASKKKTVSTSTSTSTSSTSTSSSSSRSLTSSKEDKELAQKVSDACKGTISDMVGVLDILESKQAAFGAGTIPKQWKFRLWNHQALLRFQLLKLAQDVICDKEKTVDESLLELSRYNFDMLLNLPIELGSIDEAKTAELYARLSYLACQIGFRFQKRKMYLESLGWCDRAKIAHDVWKGAGSRESDVKMNTQWLALLKAECLRVLGRPEEGLKWLAKELASDPNYWERPTVCYDVYEQIPWTEISTHWVTLYKDIWTFNPEFNKCSLDFLEEDESFPIDQEVISRVLRLELNTHFSTRHGVPSGMVAIGEALVERSGCHFDNVLGYVAMASGHFFGSPDQVDFAVKLIHDAVEFLESDEFFRRERNADSTAFLSGLVSIWRGLCLLKTHQYFVEAEMLHLKEQFIAENQEKFKDRDTGEEIRGVSGLSILNLGHERDWVTSLVHGIEIFFRFTESEEVLKKFSNQYCPSLVLLTCRLSACLLISVGDPLNGVKAWHVVKSLAKVYDKKGILVLSASEILKVIPDLECETVVEADKANEDAHEGNLIKHNRAVSYRLSLAKSVACYNLKLYQQGVDHLLKVFKYFESNDNFDATHHLLGEATYVLSWYRGIQFSHSVDLSSLPEALVKMSPAGIATKAFKTLGGMTRDPDVANSGWTDLVHNYFLLSSLFNVGAYTMRVLRESGKTRELKCFISDLVTFAQHCGFVSRSIAIIVPMITLDITARNFYHAQMKIDAISQVLTNSVCPEEKDDGEKASYSKIMENLKLPITLQRMDCMNDLKWALKTLDIPSLYYRNRSEKVVTALKKDLRAEFNNTTFKFPDWMRHNLSCSCYICSHPSILPMAFEFLHAQAKYLNSMSKAKSAMAVLETSKLCHERTIFRLIYNLSLLTMPLSVIGSKKGALKAVEIIFTPFCVGPGLDALMTQMTICPDTDIKMILSAMKKAKLIIETLDQNDYIGKSFPLELGYSAIYKYFVSSGEIKIAGSEIQDIIERKLHAQEKENRSLSPDRVIQIPDDGDDSVGETKKKVGAVMGPPPIQKKGILKVTSKRGVKPKEEIVDERPIHHIPILNFESVDLGEFGSMGEEGDDNSSSSSVSTSSLSVSRGQPQAQKGKTQRSQKTVNVNVNPALAAGSGVTERRPRRGAAAAAAATNPNTANK